MERISVTITNWGKHQRGDVKKPTWFALDNGLLDNPDLADFTPMHFHVLIYLFSQASKRNSADIEIVFAHAQKYGIKNTLLLEVLEKLEQRSIVTVHGKNPHAHVQNLPATDKTNKQTNKHTSVTPTCASEDLFNLWNSHCGTLPKLRSLGNARKNRAKNRLKEQPNLEVWKQAIERIARSEFCTGHSSTGWLASFDWLIKPDTLTKILEGTYDTRKTNAIAPRFNQKPEPRPINQKQAFEVFKEQAETSARLEAEAPKISPEQQKENAQKLAALIGKTIKTGGAA